ncbi:MAG: hypothetical protein AAFX09_13025 [Pseudomonadota bacterium]
MKTSCFRHFALAAAFVGAAMGAPSLAQDRDSDAVEALLACRNIEAVEARLACFDEQAASLAAAIDTADLMVMAAQAVREAEREGFGIALPGQERLFSLFANRRNNEGAEPVVEALADGAEVVYRADGGVDTLRGAPVKSVRVNRAGKRVVELENGQVWVQTESRRLRGVRDRHLEEGLTATIERGLLGSFFMELSHDGTRYRARRIE